EDQQWERDHHEPVRDADPGPLEHPGVSDDLDEGHGEPLTERPLAFRFHRTSHTHGSHDLADAQSEQGERDHGEDRGDDAQCAEQHGPWDTSRTVDVQTATHPSRNLSYSRVIARSSTERPFRSPDEYRVLE